MVDIVVEDGTCVASANSYSSYEDVVSFLENFVTISEYSEDGIKSAIVRGHTYLTLSFASRLMGTGTCSSSFLDFPRNDLYVGDAQIVGIPDNVKEASLWSSLQSLLGPTIEESVQETIASRVSVSGLLHVEFKDDALRQTKVDYAGLIKSRIESLFGDYLVSSSFAIARLVRVW